MNKVDMIEKAQMRDDLPVFKAGDTVKKGDREECVNERNNEHSDGDESKKVKPMNRVSLDRIQNHCVLNLPRRVMVFALQDLAT